MKFRVLSCLFLIAITLFSCKQKQQNQSTVKSEVVLFKLVNPDTSTINFNNKLTENVEVNYFTYPYIYMGGGVAVGDINNDGLQDLFFTSNMENNRLYLNKGDMKFEDITIKAGISGDDRWDTGVTMADVNGDGFLDIYVSVSGKWTTTKNLLYINNQDLTFTEQAEKMGLADEGQSTQATFFDYDKDGDLDVYIANYPATPFNTPSFVFKRKMDQSVLKDSDHLYRNDQGSFIDVTEAAGLLNFGLSLSASVGDFNKNGYPDIYVSNDFASPDYFYFNNGDGTFSEKIKEVTKHTAFYGMGVDVADFNNDQLLDIFQVDMTPEDNFRSKANMASMNIDGFYEMIDLGLHYQYMQNVLQVNNGISSDSLPRFGDISRMNGMALTDWSWSPLFADLDNDGWKDLYVTNGSRRDINNKDYFKKVNDKSASVEKDPLADLKKSLDIPETKVDNYAFKNTGDLSFEKVTNDWGLSKLGFSNGSAYGDLDNDGDLDLVINNIDDVASVFENQSEQLENHNFIRIKFKGPKWNQFGLDSKVSIETGGEFQYAENYNTRGFQSASEPYVHFGIGATKTIDKLTITWFDGKIQELKNLKVNQEFIADYNQAIDQIRDTISTNTYFQNITDHTGIDFEHKENLHNDFRFEVLLPHETSHYGPGLAVGDISGNGKHSFFVGGAKNQPGALYTEMDDGTFEKQDILVFEEDKGYEDLGALIFDANGDGFNDLYVVSGGNEFLKDDPMLQDRLYINDKKGSFVKTMDALPEMYTSGSRVKKYDYDKDGDLDLFVGGRMIPKSYPLPAKSYILRNDSENDVPKFTDVTNEIAEDLVSLGMVTDAVWTDFNTDGAIDLVVVGEWMPITFFENNNGKFVDKTEQYGIPKSSGWWYSITASDFDNDGDDDLIAGNLGLNYKYKATQEESFDVYLSDYDKNGKKDIVLGYYYNGTQFPLRGRQCSSEQIPAIKNKFEDYNSFATASLKDVYTEDELKSSEIHYQAHTFASTYLENKNKGEFDARELPRELQVSAINKILVEDFNQDGNKDILVAGNLFVSEVETTRNDASYGKYLEGDGKGNFKIIPFSKSGFIASKDVKDMELLKTNNGFLVIIANNDEALEVLEFKK